MEVFKLIFRLSSISYVILFLLNNCERPLGKNAMSHFSLDIGDVDKFLNSICNTLLGSTSLNKGNTQIGNVLIFHGSQVVPYIITNLRIILIYRATNLRRCPCNRLPLLSTSLATINHHIDDCNYYFQRHRGPNDTYHYNCHIKSRTIIGSQGQKKSRQENIPDHILGDMHKFYQPPRIF